MPKLGTQRDYTDALVGTLSALVAGATFGGMVITGKLAYQAGVSTGTLVLLRADIGLLLMWGYFLFRRRSPGVPGGSSWRLLVPVGIAYSAQVALFYGSLFLVPAGVASLLVFTYPALTALFAWLSGQEKLSGLKFVALALTLTGVAFVLGKPGSGYDPLGVLMALGAATAQAVYVLGIGRMTKAGDPFRSVLFVMSGAAAALTAGVLLMSDLDLLITARGAGWGFFHCALLPVGIAAYVRAVRLIGPTLTAIGDTTGPVTAVLLAAFFLREHLDMVQVMGAGLVLLGTMTVPLIRLVQNPGFRPSSKRRARVRVGSLDMPSPNGDEASRRASDGESSRL